MNFVYPTAAEMAEILPDLVSRDRADRIGLQLFPPVARNTFQVRWSQKDNAYGLMQMRGLDGQPPRVQRLGLNTFVYEPGVYGEHVVITEREMLTRAIPGRPDIPIPIGDLVNDADQLLISRRNDRMEASVWTLAGTGVLTIALPGPNGPAVYSDSYTIQTYTATIPWATAATATPILNFQTAQQMQVGHGVDFGAGAVAYMNQYTANLLLNNANAADFGGRRTQYGATINNMAAAADYWQSQNLPRIVVYDAGYQLAPLSGPITNAATQFIKFIPNGKVIIIGKRPGNQPVGEWQQTLQAMMPGGNPSPGEYRFVKDYAQGIHAPVEVPPKIEVHAGFNGGCALMWPSSVLALTV